jgi:ArsR family transcriptional regulator
LTDYFAYANISIAERILAGARRVLMPELSQFKAEFFKALAHPLRIRIIDALRGGEVGVNELSARLGVEQTTLSQQLAVLRNRSLVLGRKNGSNVLYSVRDPAIFRLLDAAREIFNNQLIDVRDLLSQVEATAGR